MKVTYDRYPELQQFLKTFVEYMATSLSARSVILYGGLTLDDFSKRYSDIDIVVVLERGLWENDFNLIDEIVSRLEKLNKELANLLYIHFIPYPLIENPRVEYNDIEGMIVRNLEQELINQYPFSSIDDFMIRNKSELLFGDDIRDKFPHPPMECFWIKFLEDIPYFEKAAKQYPFQPATSPKYNVAINWILYFSRMLYSLKNNDVIGKLKGAYWFSNEYFGKIGDFVVEIAKCRQRNISLANVMNVVENSRELFLFSIKTAFQIKNIHVPDLNNLLKIEGQTANFTRIFMEIRNIVENIRKAS